MTDEEKLVEALFYVYRRSGGWSSDCKTGACMLSHCGLGGGSLDGFIRMVKAQVDEVTEEKKERDDAA